MLKEDHVRASTQLQGTLDTNLPNINLDEKKRILNSIGLNKINNARNVQTLVRQWQRDASPIKE